MKALLFLLFAGIAAAQNPGVCSRVLNSPAPGQVLSATNASHAPPCQWTNNGGGGGSVSLTATGPIVITPSPTTGTGVISCPTCSTGTTPGGSTTQLQYNNSSAFGGITGATSDGTNLLVTTQSSSDSSTKAASTAFVAAAMTVQTKSVTLTPTDILSLGATPVQALAAPGAGFTYIIIRAIATLDFNANAYTTCGGNINLYYNNKNTQVAVNNMMGVNDVKSGSSVLDVTTGGNLAGITPISNVVNVPIVIQQNSVTECLAGDSNIVVTFSYFLAKTL